MNVELRPLREADLDTLVGFLREASVARWWGMPRDDAALREDLRNGEADAFAILADGELAGWLGSWEEREPDHRHGGLDIMLGEAFQGCGIGREALRLGARGHIEERGHHRITIDPALANARAIRCYEAVGFRPVGVTRRSERAPDGSWEDGLLMELLAEDLT
jgi:aminoglycoside 6'-N-acetyltransferase